MDHKKELEKISDKTLHCLARIIQDESNGTNAKCLYCKYAVECSEEWEKTKKVFFMELLQELETSTSVNILANPKAGTVDFIEGSWMEKYPDVLEMLTSKSFEEQQDILMDPDILQYLDS